MPREKGIPSTSNSTATIGFESKRWLAVAARWAHLHAIRSFVSDLDFRPSVSLEKGENISA